jgi:hypothetical protein
MPNLLQQSNTFSESSGITFNVQANMVILSPPTFSPITPSTRLTSTAHNLLHQQLLRNHQRTKLSTINTSHRNK